MKLSGWLVCGVLVSGAVSCGSTPPKCDATSCSAGCCDASGTCQPQGSCGGSTADAGTRVDLSSASNILNYLEGKTLVMKGTDLPPFPNGINEDINYGGTTQCFSQIELEVSGGNFELTQQLASLEGTAQRGETGTCNHAVATTTQIVNSRSVQIENIAGNGECFDVTMDFGAYVQEGRASLNPDGGTLTLEVFFAGQATRHRCANGAVGSGGVMINGTALGGDARQVYRY